MSVPQRDDGDPGGRQREPVFNSLPPGVLIVALPIILAQLVSWTLPEAGRWIFEACVVAIAGPGVQLAPQPLGPYFPLIGHVLVHFGMLHIAMNLVILVSMGRTVCTSLGWGRRGTTGFIALFVLSSIAGAVAQIVMNGGEQMLMAGASTGVSGVLVAGGWAMGGYRGMLRFALPWIGVNLLLGLLGMAWPIPVGWAAHIGGAVAGAILFPFIQAIFRDA
ncbi:MAG: rhomboid family intramembrane serine protease [Alphaproteobacteria bacterium]|nr:rhomboid family intramembrane serine protease [Alphaproteobacteria bacterium]